MTTRLRTAAAATCLAAVLAATGCGGSKKDEGDPIPGGVASALKADMSIVEKRLSFAQDHPNTQGVGSCDDIANDSFPSIDNHLSQVPDSVGSDVRDALNQSFDNLKNLASSACDKVKSDSEQTDTTTETTPTETIAPTPTETTPTETTPTQTETTPDKTKTNKAPKIPNTPQQNNGNGGQGSGGNQGGGAGAPRGGTP